MNFYPDWIAVYRQTRTRDQTFEGVPVQLRPYLVNLWPNYVEVIWHNWAKK